MKYHLLEISGSLAFRGRSLRALGERRSVPGAVICFSLGFLAYLFMRRWVYAGLPEIALRPSSPIGWLWNLNLLQTLFYLLAVHVPGIVLAAGTFSGDSAGFRCSSSEYRRHVSALLPLWGALCLIVAPVQWLVPHFLIVGWVEISIGMLARVLLLAGYTFWAIRQLHRLSPLETIGAFVLSCVPLPIYVLIILNDLFFLFLVLLLLLGFGYASMGTFRTFRSDRRRLQESLHALEADPHDADAHYRIGCIHLNRGNPDPAQGYFAESIRINPQKPEYHYCLGRVHELQGAWDQALLQYEEARAVDPGGSQDCTLRECGKGYLHTGREETAIELLKSYLERSGSDPEGRYWLAVALQKMGDEAGMRFHLGVIADQARSGAKGFRRQDREWIRRAAEMRREFASLRGR